MSENIIVNQRTGMKEKGHKTTAFDVLSHKFVVQITARMNQGCRGTLRVNSFFGPQTASLEAKVITTPANAFVLESMQRSESRGIWVPRD